MQGREAKAGEKAMLGVGLSKVSSRPHTTSLNTGSQVPGSDSAPGLWVLWTHTWGPAGSGAKQSLPGPQVLRLQP